MLRKIVQRPIDDQSLRKEWYTSESMDLFVWLNKDQKVGKFHLSYDKPLHEKCLIWDRETGSRHSAVDEGSQPGKHPASPILIEDVPLDRSYLSELLTRECGELEAAVVALILDKIRTSE